MIGWHSSGRVFQCVSILIAGTAKRANNCQGRVCMEGHRACISTHALERLTHGTMTPPRRPILLLLHPAHVTATPCASCPLLCQTAAAPLLCHCACSKCSAADAMQRTQRLQRPAPAPLACLPYCHLLLLTSGASRLAPPSGAHASSRIYAQHVAAC